MRDIGCERRAAMTDSERIPPDRCPTAEGLLADVHADCDRVSPRRSAGDRADQRPAGGPDALGRYGSFGGRFVPETLMDALNQLAEAYEQARADPEFQARLG